MMKTTVVALQGLNSPKLEEPSCSRAGPKSNKVILVVNGHRISPRMLALFKEATRIMFFTRGRPHGRSSPPSTGKKLRPLSITFSSRRTSLPYLKKFSKKNI
jgi:hypothetical protein